ncbi:MAG: SOS response-associated peptidase [Bacillota bacterium]
MCGRYFISAEEDILEMRRIISEINRRYYETPMQASIKTGEVFPTDYAPVLVQGANAPRAGLMRWGFPKRKGSGVIINARSETAREKGMFSIPLLRQRCVVPTTGFFEWRHEGGKIKKKYLFRLPGTKMLYLAGLYSACSLPGKAPYQGYIVLTAAANGSIAEYHDRMPLILQQDQLKPWLTDTPFALDFVHTPCTAMLQADKH